MKVVLKERMPSEEMFTVIDHKRNVAPDQADHLKNQTAEPARSGTNAGRAKLACSSHFFFVGLAVS